MSNFKIIKPEIEYGIIHRRNNTSHVYNGWPSVCRDDRGVLYAVGSSLRITHVDPTGKNCMFISFNEGKTWTPPIIVHDDYLDDRDAGIISLGGGKMVLSSFNEFIEDYCEQMLGYDFISDYDKCLIKGTGDSWRQLPEKVIREQNCSYVKVSDDYGVTWSDIIKVPLTAPHGPCLLSDGTLLYMGKEMNPKYLADNPIVVYSSHDDGKTWEYTGTVPEGEDCRYFHMHEPHVVELPNGRVLGAVRVHARETDPQSSIYFTFSDDKGKTWSTPKFVGIDGLPPHLMVHSSGAVICSYGCRSDGNWGERACVSYDNGETWTEDYDLLRGKVNDLGYPASVELSDGTILTVFYQSPPDIGGANGILYTKWRLGEK